MDSGDDNTSVRVALRIRPQLPKERIDMCQVCTSVTPGVPQVFLGKDKAFTFDYVYDMDCNQQQIYESCASALIEGTFEGYNATIFAYGQTGSGKTYTMGTGFGLGFREDEIGIVPRAVEHLFNGIEARRKAAIEKGEPPPEFKVLAQFMEIYYEEILDLLDTTRDASDKKGKSHIKIHEDASGSIYTVGMTTRQVTSLQETMQCLKNGALSRTTASTNMNAESSRSHAIFTLVIKQQRVVMETMPDDDGKERDTTEMFTDFETLTAKFHFVDLAGSERLKRTGATGNRAKEGISINCGLLALGNVISALGDKTKKGSHVPYRDSKLTRLLQDSLGGNSRTVMIACVSPSDRDFMETLNTLKYANRARNIKNKVSINQDKTSKQMAALRAEILELQQELMLYRTGKRMVDADGMESINDMFHENTMLQTENNNLRRRVKALQETVDTITAKNIALLAEHSLAMITSGEGSEENKDQVKALIEGYMKETEELRAKLLESEAMCRVNSRSESVLSSVRESHSQMSFMSTEDSNVSEVLALAKREVRVLKKKTSKQRHGGEKREKETLSEDEKQEHEAAEGEEPGEEKEEEKEEEEEEGSEEETEGNEGSEEEELELDMSSNSESEEETDNLHEDLADLTCEISIKQKLIEQLELSQRKLSGLRSQYEGKLLALTTRIKETEVERDKVLSNLGEVESHSQDAAKRIREQYEKKLNDMQNEMKKLNSAKREHAKLLRNQQQSEKQLKMMQNDLKEMKKLKVKLMNQIKDETLKVRRVEQRRSKEMAQFKKEQRQKDNQIRTLEAETKKKDVMIRRKQEEMALLRRAQQQRPMSSKVAGRVARYDRPVTVPRAPIGVRKRKREFSAKAAKSKWDELEKCVTQIIIKRQTLSHMERDMERWLKQRASLSKKLEKFGRKKEKAISENKDEHLLEELDDQISGLQDNIAYVQENISDCQSNIMQMEESKDIDQEPVVTLNSCDSLEEAKYLLEHFVLMSISKGVLAAQKEAESKELVAKLHQERMDGTFQRDMLQYLIRDKVDLDIDDSLLMQRDDSDSDSDTSSCSLSPIESAMESPSCVSHSLANAAMLTSTPSTGLPGAVGSLDSVSTSTSSIPGRKDKARRKTATPEDLLYAGGTEPTLAMHPILKSLEMAPKVNGTTVATTTPSPTTTTNNTFLMPPPRTVPPRPRLPSQTPPARLENGATSRHDTLTRHDSTPSPAATRKSFTKLSAVTPDMSPNTRRRAPPSTPVTATTSSSGSLSRHSSSNDVGETTPPCSPLSIRRSRPDNVFSRLTSQASPLSPNPSRGVISQVPSKTPPGGVMPLIHTHSALGHSKAVLSVFATEDLLFSSSKDRTCKIWDLHTGEEILTLTGHPNNVVAVRYSEETSLVYTVSTYFIKVWDVREGNKCIKTLTSSGFTNDGVLAMKSTSRQVTCPPGETNITDVVVNSTGTVLYSAAGNTVRIWDLNSFKAVGKLSGGHQAAVMVLAVDDTDTADGNICVVTGSKDHYIKVFEVSEDSVGVMCPKYNLEPPHYDGIQSLCLMGDLLFSGSRDTCIKKWDLSQQQLKQSINNSHKDWICGLAFMPGGNCLLSGCRGGLLKLWNIDTCNMLGEIRAHDSPINSITTNSSLIFTASNDTDIHIWQPQWDQLPSSVMPSDEIFI